MNLIGNLSYRVGWSAIGGAREHDGGREAADDRVGCADPLEGAQDINEAAEIGPDGVGHDQSHRASDRPNVDFRDLTPVPPPV